MAARADTRGQRLVPSKEVLYRGEIEDELGRDEARVAERLIRAIRAR